MDALSCMPGEDLDGEDFGDWDSEVGIEPVRSLLGSHTVASAAAAWAELHALAGFDGRAVLAALPFPSPYHAVRLINYLRAGFEVALGRGDVDANAIVTRDAALLVTGPEGTWSGTFGPEAALWADDSLLRPVLPDDTLLLAALEVQQEEDEKNNEEARQGDQGDQGGQEAQRAALQEEVYALRAELAAASALLNRAISGMVGAGDGGSEDEDSEASGEDEGKVLPGKKTKALKETIDDEAPEQDNDTYYFQSYAGSGIHAEMLRDAVRTDAYRRAILGLGPAPAHAHPALPEDEVATSIPAPWFAGKNVLDVGCGTGILSIFSARAGAAHVTALDASAVAAEARAIVAANGFADTVMVVQGKAEAYAEGRLSTAPRPVHAIVSEWMGYALLYENMLPGVLVVRDALLAEGGRMLPSHAHIRLGAVSSPSLWNRHVGWWSGVYGVNMSGMSRHGLEEAVVEVLPASALASDPGHAGANLATLRMLTVQDADLDIVSAPFSITMVAGKEGEEGGSAGQHLHALALWFDIDFRDDPKPSGAAKAGLPDDLPDLESASPVAAIDAKAAPESPFVSFSTGPHATPTHWQQALLLLPSPIPAPPGSIVTGTLSMVRDTTNPRTYRFAVEAQVAAVDGGAQARSLRHSWRMR